MGIKHLWTVLTPFCDRKPLYELQGKTVAVDLSCWICEAQNIAEYQVQLRMYLRNLYFRTCYLLLLDVSPVFVLEGKAPELKYDTISARNAIQFKGAKPKTDSVKTGKDRTRFHFVLRQCEEMLGCMGLACVKGTGEAESLCAYLNEGGLVDGCISQDSDCFAYGAQVVYRNFSISTQGAQASSGGAVDVYDIRKVNENLRFGRNKIVAMALLIGSDYSEGVYGIGKDSVLKFFETISDEDVIERLRSWRKNVNMFKNYEQQLADKNICTSCGHNGKVQSHTKKGCTMCKTISGCDPFKYKEERLKIKNEVNLRNKAIKDPNFPNENLIKEFLVKKDNVKELDLNWKQPNIIKFVKFTTKFLQWEEYYAFEKFLPILTRWQCRHYKLLKNTTGLKGILRPDKIKKVRNPKGVPSYEIIWSDPNDSFKGLIPDSQIMENNIDLEKLWSTIEPQTLVDVAYPQLVEDYRLSKIKPKKATRRRKNNKENIEERMENVSISEPKPKKSRRPRVPKGQKPIDSELEDLNSSLKQLTVTNKPKKSTKTTSLDNFVKKAITNSYYEKKFSTPTKPLTADLSFDLDDDDDLDLSNIVDNIVSRQDLKNHFKDIASHYVGEVVCVDDDADEEQENVAHRPNLDKKLNVSSFFIPNNELGDDLFEEAINSTFRNFEKDCSSGSETEEYDFELKKDEDIVCDKGAQDMVSLSSDEDSFCNKDLYVPLMERIKAK